MDDGAALVRYLHERACERLILLYAHYVDNGQATRVADLFTPDGTWTGPAGRTLSDREEIRAAFQGRQQLTRRLSRHVLTNVLVDWTGANGATGSAYLVNYRHDYRDADAERPGPARHPKFVGDYSFTFRQLEKTWYIRSLHFDLVFLRKAGE